MPNQADITLGYELTGAGWATVTLSSLSQRAVMTVSYSPSSPLEDLAGAALALVGPWGVEAPRSFTWHGEPEEWDWHLQSRGEESLHIRIVHRDDARVRATSSEPIFEADVPRFAFARAVLRSMQRLREGLGPEEYAAQWRRPFPEDLYRRLHESLRGPE